MATRRKIETSGPHKVSKTAWYYIESDGVFYVQEEHTKTPEHKYVRTNMVKIPWRVVKSIFAKATK